MPDSLDSSSYEPEESRHVYVALQAIPEFGIIPGDVLGTNGTDPLLLSRIIYWSPSEQRKTLAQLQLQGIIAPIDPSSPADA